jgi:uncharacterized damage-inducible protein DinB
MDRELIKKYSEGGEELGHSIEGLTAADLQQAPPADAGPEIGRWTIQQVVVHLADAEAAFADRVRRVIAEDDPVLQAWDENRFAERLMYPEQSAEDAAALVSLTRRQLGRVLRKLPEEAFERAGRHSERGRQTLAEILAMAVWHMNHHLNFIKAKREHFGKPMG